MRYKRLFAAIFTTASIPGLTHAASGFQNPLTSSLTQELLKGFITSLIYVGMPVVVVLIVIVGFRFTLAQGNAENLASNRMFTVKVFIGSVIFFALWAIAQMLGATIGALSVGTVFVVVAFALYLIFFQKQK